MQIVIAISKEIMRLEGKIDDVRRFGYPPPRDRFGNRCRHPPRIQRIQDKSPPRVIMF